MENRKEFKERLQRDDKVADADKFAEEAHEGWKTVSPDRFDELLASVDARIEEKVKGESAGIGPAGKIVSLTLYRWLAVAAAVVLLAVAWWVADNRFADTEKLYASYFQVRTHPDAMVRGDNEMVKDVQYKAVTAYVANDYATAIREYELLLKMTPEEPKYTLFLAISCMAEGQTDKAIRLLEGFSAKNNPYEADMRWYLSLAYLKQGSVNTAKGLLDSLSKGDSYYSDTAKELLSAMK